MPNRFHSVEDAFLACLSALCDMHGDAEDGDEPALQCEELENRSMMSAAHPVVHDVPLITPTGVTVAALTPGSVRVTWTDTDRNALGFHILRSDNGGEFRQIWALANTASVRSYIDTSAAPNHTYSYEIDAYNGPSRSSPSSPASATTPMAAPASVSAAAQGTTAALVQWRNCDASTTGYTLWRASDGVNFSLLSTITDPATTSYTDSAVSTGIAYTYKVKALNDTNTSLFSAAAKAAIPLAAPTGLQAAPQPNSVALTWSGLDARARNYIVWRSSDARTYRAVATLAASATSFTDTRLATGTTYTYRVQATNPVAPAASTENLAVTTTLLTPTSATAATTGANITVTWADANRAGMSYLILRSSDGGNSYSQIAQLPAGAAKKFVDTTGDRNQTYSYQVEATAVGLTSAASNTATATTPDGTSTVTIASRFGNELVITALGTSDTISISQTDDTLSIVADGQTFFHSVLAAGLFIYDRALTDLITIDTSVTVRTTIVSIGFGISSIISAGGNVSAWIDSSESFTGQGVAHRVNTYGGGVSKALGAAMANPKDSGATRRVNQTLWGLGPDADDVNQGAVGDCYFLSSLAAFAESSPGVLLESAVDMGDGTYTVQFMKGANPFFVRVSGDMPAGNFAGLKFAHPGTSTAIWSLVFEKAFAYFRKGLNTYASISSGWMGEVYSGLGVRWAGVSLQTNESSLYTMLSNDLANHRAVTFGTHGASPNLVRGHAYTLIGASIDGNGITHYQLRNPWGTRGSALEDNQGYVTLTFAQMQSNFSQGVQAAA